MAGDRPNIILLTVDALGAGHVSSQGYSRQTTPAIDALGAANVQFTSAFSASSHTREAIPALLTGCYPDVAVTEQYSLRIDSIAERLREAGYATGGFHSNPFVSRAFGFGAGFDTFDDDLYLGQNKFVALFQRGVDKLRNRHYARATEINERALTWLNSIDDRPFFLWNHYMDPHGPYEPPERYQLQFRERPVAKRECQRLYRSAIESPADVTERERRTLVDLYDAEIAYLDEHVDAFLTAVAERGGLEDTLLILTADHGDLFGEHGYYEHPRYPFRELSHVPLVVDPPIDRSRVDSDPVSTIDVVPTILDQVGLSTAETEGISLQSRWERPDADAVPHRFGQAATTTDDGERLRRFAIHTATDTELVEYRLSDDGGEPTDRFTPSDERLEELLTEHARERMLKTSGRAAVGRDPGEAADVSDEVEDRLDALGYTDR